MTSCTGFSLLIFAEILFSILARTRSIQSYCSWEERQRQEQTHRRCVAHFLSSLALATVFLSKSSIVLTTSTSPVTIRLRMIQDVAAVVAAAANSRGIGYQGQLPWKLPGDMAHFQKVTTQAPSGKMNAVVMGRKTWESIPKRFRPLPGRTNLILTSAPNVIQNEDAAFSPYVLVASSLTDAWTQLEQLSNLHQVFIIGGARVYQECFDADLISRVVYTQVSNLPDDTHMDTFFPELPSSDWECQPFVSGGSVELKDDATDVKGVDILNSNDKENNPNAHLLPATKLHDAKSKVSSSSATIHTDPTTGILFQFLEYTKIPQGRHINPEEMQYLDICRDILETGVVRGDRTGTGTKSKFGVHMRFNLRNGVLPLLTTKRTFWRGVAEELLWFISGNTNANELAAKDIHIWDGNGSREFLDARGLLHREQGDLGPVYGFQWRHFGATYVDMHTDYTGQGVDQLADCIDKIIHNPEDRRIIMSAWNPADLNLMALPPCHMFCQFYVDTNTNELSCQMYQRSADMGLGVPFNIASYALLAHLIAHVTGRKPGELIHTIGDAHIYLNHVDAIEEQLKRQPRAFPTLSINTDKMNIDDIVFDDLKVTGYKPHKAIAMKMAV